MSDEGTGVETDQQLVARLVNELAAAMSNITADERMQAYRDLGEHFCWWCGWEDCHGICMRDD